MSRHATSAKSTIEPFSASIFSHRPPNGLRICTNMAPPRGAGPGANPTQQITPGAGMLYQTRVAGHVQVLQNPSLYVDGREEWSSIAGNVEAHGCASALLDGSVSVGGNLQIQACQKTSGFTGPGIKIHGNFLCQNNPGGCKALFG